MTNKDSHPPFSLTLFIIILSLPALISSSAISTLRYNEEDGNDIHTGHVVRRDQMKELARSECGDIMSIDVTDGRKGPYHIQFITMEPHSLFLPVVLHADMVFYVHTGSGNMSWAHGTEDEISTVPIKRGDIHRLRPGSVFFLQSDLRPERQKLRINAIFANTDEDVYDPAIGAYSNVRDLIRGFDTNILRSAFQVSDEVIESITNATGGSAIVHAVTTTEETFWDLKTRFLKTFLRASFDDMSINKKKHKKKKDKDKDKGKGDKEHKSETTFNVFESPPDFKNCNGWSTTVNEGNSPLLSGSNIGLFMVNLTKGSMMGPHWNPRATEIAVVLHGEGMVRVVCSSTAKRSQCRNLRFRVQEGDVFAVPMFHPMAQMSYNNDSLVFMGFSTTTTTNYPQFLAGKYSVLHTLNRQILAVSLNVTDTTIDQLLAAQAESFILDCTSCAEEEEKALLEEVEKEREEEESKKREEEREKEEEQRKREEEEARRRREEKEEQKRREEEQRQREEEARREEEKRRKREEEEEQRKREEEARREEKEEAEEERRKREEERQQEEQERERQQEEEERKREEAAQREQEESRRQQEERAREEQEEAMRQQEERAREEQEEAMRQQEERAREQQEERSREQQEEAMRQQEERAREQQEERAREEQEEAMRQQEERAREQQEERSREQQEEAMRQQEERAREQQEEAIRQQEERAREQQEERAREEQEEAMRQQEERAGEQQEEEARRQEEEAPSGEEEARRQQEDEYSERKEEEAQTEKEEAWRQQEEKEGKTRQQAQVTGDDQRFVVEAGRREI